MWPSEPKTRPITTWPISWIRMETKTHSTHINRYSRPGPDQLQPSRTDISQKNGCTRTSIPNIRQCRSNGVGCGIELNTRELLEWCNDQVFLDCRDGRRQRQEEIAAPRICIAKRPAPPYNPLP